jgi:diaminopimelate decarboxylase
MRLSKEAIKERKKAFSQALRKAVKIRLAYKSFSPEAEFRLFKALSMLLTEGDILEYLKKSSGKTKN